MKKTVRFNYFEIVLVPAELSLLEEYGEDVEDYTAEPWDMSEMLDYLMVKKDNFRTTVDIGDEYAEIEKDTYYFEDKKNIYSFQLSKLRETNIPSKKRFGEIREDILLRKDEYIGEFNSFIFDNEYNAVVLQSNLYGLTVKQTEHVLTQIRFRYLDTLGKTEDQPLVVKLLPLIDKSKINKVKKADYYKKIRVKGADFMLDAALGEDSLLSDAKRLLFETSGLNIDITISLGRTEKTRSLDTQYIQKVIDQFERLDSENKPQVEVTSLYDSESDTETINLIEPRMTDKITIDVTPRQTVAHEYLYNRFMEDIYDKKRPDVRRVLRPIAH